MKATNFKKNIRNIVIVIMGTLLIGCSRSELPEGIVESGRMINLFRYTGDIEIERTQKGEAINPYEGVRLIEGDIVSTQGAGEAFIVLDGDKVVKLHKNTTIELVELESGKADKTTIKLLEGEVTSGVSKLDDNESYQIETQNATMGVRGTIFKIAEVAGEPVLKVYSGTVEIEDEKNAGILVHKMQQVHSIQDRRVEGITELDDELIYELKGVFEEIIEESGEETSLVDEFEEVIYEQKELKEEIISKPAIEKEEVQSKPNNDDDDDDDNDDDNDDDDDDNDD